MPDELLSTSEAARLLGVSAETVRRWAERKRIKHIVLPSGQRRFRRQDIDAALAPVETQAS